MFFLLLIAAGEISPRLLVPAVPVVRAAVRFEERISAADLAALRRAGASPVEVAGGEYAAVGRIVSVDVAQADLKKVAAVSGVERIDPAIPPVVAMPLDLTSAKVGAPIAWTTPSDERFAGAGIVVADHEGGWNIFHPDFFFLDGGRYDFEDLDGDGRAGAGDCIDLDGDGTFESPLTLWEGRAEDWYTAERFEEPGFQPDVDWLFVDFDRNGVRDAGSLYSDLTPGMGEPTFAGDDVDGDRILDRGERLLRLGTSKVIAVVVEGQSYIRGRNLSRYPVLDFDVSHGTGAVGIVSAGAIGVRRYTGIAPEAELVLIAESDPIVSLATARALGAHISFYEWNSPADHQDGSGPFEVALSDAAAEGMVQLAAAGNLANADHVMELIDVSGDRKIEFTTDDLGVYDYRTLWLNLHWNAPRAAMSVRIVGITSGTLDASEPFAKGIVDGISFVAFSEETAAGNGSVLIIGSSVDGAPLPSSVITVEVRTGTTTVGRVRGVLFDDQAGWSKGVSWLTARTDSGSALMPSTADTVIAVAAYGGRHDLDLLGWGSIDERRSYSGMGPRIDGAPLIDISAPDDPFSPSAYDPAILYSTFGGTSGALPHAAGSAAVLLSSGAPLSHSAIEQMLTQNARADTFTSTVPNEAYGYGKIDLGRAIFGEPFTDTTPPTIALLGPDTAVAGRRISIEAQPSQPGGDSSDVLVAWDLGYDGSEEQQLNASLRFTTTPTATGVLRLVARAKNVVTGRSARALYVADIIEDCNAVGCVTGCCRFDGRCAECANDAGRPSILLPDAVAVPQDSDSKCGCNTTSSRSSPLLLLLLSAGLLLRRARARSPRW